MRRSVLSSLFLALAGPSLLASALSDADLETVFGQGATGLSGGSVQLPQFLYTVVTNASHAVVSLNATGSAPSQVGWMASAIGTAMANGDFLITWPTIASKVSWTLSHRKTAGGEFMPTLASVDPASSTTALFTLVPALSTSDPASSFTVVTYTRALNFPNSLSATLYRPLTRASTTFLYASSTVGPGSADEGATLQQHNQAHSTTTLDLSTSITLASASGGAPSGGVSAGGGSTIQMQKYNRRDMLLIAHAAIGSIAMLVMMPLAILIGRFLRHSQWFPAHAGILVLAAALVIVTFALGYTQTRSPHFTYTHNQLGLAILILVLLQVGFGAVAHRIPHDRAARAHSLFPTLEGNNLVRLAHIFSGIVIVLLGFAQVNRGFIAWNYQNSLHKKVPRAVTIVFWVWLAVVAVLYIAGWVKEAAGAKRRRQTPYSGHGEKVDSQENQ